MALLPVLKKFGDIDYAKKLYSFFIKENKLIENADPAILEVLGALQYDDVKSILAAYVFENSTSDYYISKSAVLGLLNFDCNEYQKEITTAIENCYQKNLFPEFVPALVCKLKDQSIVLDKLYELGSQYASTDCNAGIILGFSLSDALGRKYFKRILFDPGWETNSTATGTIHFAYLGMKYAGITFNELFQELKQNADKENLAYSLEVFFALTERKLIDWETSHGESYVDMYDLFFHHTNDKGDNLTDLAMQVNKIEEATNIEKLIEQKMLEEAVLSNFTA